jgi:hypothetical protein
VARAIDNRPEISKQWGVLNRMNLRALFRKPFFFLAVAAVMALLLIMLKLVVYQDYVFSSGDPLTTVEWFIALDFLCIALFNVVSIIWLVHIIHLSGKPVALHKTSLMLGVFVPAFISWPKTMIDEIGRESELGWETTGEWIILYLFFAIQLFYSLVIIKLIKKETPPENTQEL